MNQSVKEPGVYMHPVISFLLQTNPHKRLSIQSHKWLQELLYSWISKHSEIIVCASDLLCCSIISVLHVNFPIHYPGHTLYPVCTPFLTHRI